MMGGAEDKRLFQLSESEAADIVAAMADCDGAWGLFVRTGATWEADNFLVFAGHGLVNKAGIEGFGVGLCFNNQVTSLGDLGPIAQIEGMKHLDASGTHGWGDRSKRGKLANLQPLMPLTGLTSVDLSWCDTLSDLSPLASLTQLKVLSLDGCEALTSLEGLQALECLETLRLGGAEGLKELSELAPLSTLKDLRLWGLNGVQDLSPLASLLHLKTLTLTKCGGLPRVDALSSMTDLKELDLSGCSALEDVSGLATLSRLEKLDLSGCRALQSLKPLEGLERLPRLDIYKCKALEDLDGLQSLRQLRHLEAWGCDALTDISALSDLENLTELNLSMCERLADLSPLSNLSSLETLDISDCPELVDPSRWGPLATLPALRSLEGSFPSAFKVGLFASAAGGRQDQEFIAKHLSDWLSVAQAHPTSVGLLSAVGRAAGCLEGQSAGVEALGSLTVLAAHHDVRDVDQLFEVVCAHSKDALIHQVLQDTIEQLRHPLPPETLQALHIHLPTSAALWDATLSALGRAVASEEAPGWTTQTAMVARQELVSAPCCPVTPSVQSAALSALEGVTWGPFESALFGALASSYTLSEDMRWVGDFHSRLTDVALAQPDEARRHQALSDIASGLAIASDGDFSLAQLDALLTAAAVVDPDTSKLHAAVARAHATAGRWDAVEQAVFAVATPALRDDCLVLMSDRVLEADLEDRARRALAFDAGLSDQSLRVGRLKALGANPAVLGDLVAYGQLVSLLAEHPQAQQEVVRHAVEARVELAEAQIPPDLGPVTERERGLSARRDALWLKTIEALDPEVAKAAKETIAEMEL